MGNAFLAEKKLSFIMKLFHFVCEKRLLNWLLGKSINPNPDCFMVIIKAAERG
jgi:hypothetical protein